MPPKKAKRLSHRQARIDQFEARTEADPLGAVQPDTDAEFTAEGAIPPGEESTTEYVERIGRSDRTAAKTKDRATARRQR